MSAALAALMVAPAGALAQQENRAQAQARVGLERDDNALREATAQPESDWLTRYLIGLEGGYRVSPRQHVVAELSHGGKLFARVRDADALVTLANVAWRASLSEDARAGLVVDLKDRSERLSLFDYQRLSVSAQLSHRLGPLELGAGAGWGVFSFKPNPAVSSAGPSVEAWARAPLPAQLSLSLGYYLTQRRFRLGRFALDEQEQIVIDPTTLRRDLFHQGRLGVSWRGPVILDAAYALSLNSSNAYGQDLLRHSGQLTLTAPLPGQLLLSAQLELLRTRYDDPVLSDANFLLDEENRNALVAALSWPFWEGWDVEARYSLYRQEFGGPQGYRRQTLSLAMGYVWD